jgi:putative NADPH-quinone reductase
MNIFIVYAHPSENSFTFAVKEELIKSLSAAGHTILDIWICIWEP